MAFRNQWIPYRPGCEVTATASSHHPWPRGCRMQTGYGPPPWPGPPPDRPCWRPDRLLCCRNGACNSRTRDWRKSSPRTGLPRWMNCSTMTPVAGAQCFYPGPTPPRSATGPDWISALPSSLTPLFTHLATRRRSIGPRGYRQMISFRWFQVLPRFRAIAVAVPAFGQSCPPHATVP
jgi:hypothetical protein